MPDVSAAMLSAFGFCVLMGFSGTLFVYWVSAVLIKSINTALGILGR